MIRNEPSFEMTFNHGGQTHIYGADDWDTIYSWMSTIHKVSFLCICELDPVGTSVIHNKAQYMYVLPANSILQYNKNIFIVHVHAEQQA